MMQSSTHIPRAQYGLWMGLATLASLGLAWGAAWFFGGSADIARKALVATCAGSLATFAPVMLRIGFEHWGLAVLMSGVARSLIALGIAYGMASSLPAESTRPLMLGTASAMGLMLLVESCAAVLVLSKLDRERVSSPAARASSHE